MALDTELRNTYYNVPPSLKYKPLSQSIIDSSSVIMNRTTIEILYLKSIIVLHRQYITEQRRNPLYDHSRHACLEAASTVLDRQGELHRATQPGSQLYDDRWMVSALTANDFILAAMVICLELTIRMRESTIPVAQKAVPSQGYQPTFSKYFNAIQMAHQIWTGASAFSIEARMASNALGSTIERINSYESTDNPHFMTFQSDSAARVGPSVPLEETSVPTDGMEYIDWVS